ncbi:CCAAT-binding transcription factor (CBF-B/NF-YA) subunit B-domain-containing protein [Coprinopsis sp. MPI-PUGE-AT-0042]|nr:CCAAT-binding transcription factor (CBF-B/NF-YA) subunit B-domain-containing protein [Coprinopsis sp. MPI-PUGE-AT-0042]
MDPSLDEQLYLNQYLYQQQPQQDVQPQIDEEPLYVNAKQYFRILKRRVARSRLDEVHRLSRQRKPYLHESRHKHAMRRPRGPGGRFLTAEEIAAQKRANGEVDPSTAGVGQDVEDNDDDEQQQQQQDPEPLPMPEPPQPIIEPEPPRMDHLHQHHHHHHHQHHQEDNFFMPSTSNFRPSMSIPQQMPNPHMAQHNPISHGHTRHLNLHHHQQPHKSMQGFASLPKALPGNMPSYTPGMQMHHVPHPHAHARHHHSNLAFHQPLYNDPTTSSSEMQRRTEEMIQFGTPGNN